jgi:hypothetical protein
VKATGDRDGGVPMMEGFLGGFFSLALSFSLVMVFF